MPFYNSPSAGSMKGNNAIQRALLSVSDKTGIVDFARNLHKLGIEIISTGGTARLIDNAGIPVKPVDEFTGFPEMLDGRVKTLHPMIHGGLLGIRDDQTHLKAMEQYGIQSIDLICINLYPFEETSSKEEVTQSEVIEQIDIGGPSMIRSAAKNYKFVTVITNANQYEKVLTSMANNSGNTTLELRKELANAAFARTAEYDKSISNWMQEKSNSEFQIEGSLSDSLRYGENPNQKAAVYKNHCYKGPSVINATKVTGKNLSFNNYIDAASALELILDLKKQTNQPSAAIIKHANPCGAAIDKTIGSAFKKAWGSDPIAAFGGIVALSEPVDSRLAKTIISDERFLEVIVAPAFKKKAAAILIERWKNLRLVAFGTDARPSSWEQIKSIEGGFLTQECHPLIANTKEWSLEAGPKPTKKQLLDASVAWITCGHLKSNSVSIVDSGVLIGGGMGQVDRVSAAKLAIARAGEQLMSAENPVAGSDAFFPFPDGPEILINAGINCIVQPGGSLRDKETIKLCEAKGITLLHTGTRCFRH